MHDEYVKLCNSGKLLGGDLYTYCDGERYIYNMVTQVLPGANAEIDLIAKSAIKALDHAENKKVKTIAIPKIGCGVGGLNWHDVKKALEQVERNRRSFFTVYEL